MYKNILIPMAPDHKGTAVNALKIAKRLADPDAVITALTVLETIPSYVSQYMPKNQKEETRERTLDGLKARISGFDGVDAIVTDGHSGQGILDYAEMKGIDCIVITSHRPGLQDFFLGSTAARVVRYFKGSVHVLRS